MAFTVQTDPPTAGANAYLSVNDLKAYWTDRGVTLSQADALLQAAIIKATQYLDVRFKYVGDRSVSGQSTEWPRNFAWDNRGDSLDGIPDQIKSATAEYAYRALSAELLADPTRDDAGRLVKSKSETVGPLREATEYVDFSTFELPEYPLADRMLISRGLVCGNPNARGIQVGSLGRA